MNNRKPLKLNVTFDVPEVLARMGEEVKKRDALLRECINFHLDDKHNPKVMKLRLRIREVLGDE